MLKIGFVVLHYMTFEDTINCVNSILDKCGDCPIVIVDNASTNDSIEKISKLYIGNNNVLITSTSENLGFAKGNNVGISLIKTKYDVDFVVVMNNDTLIIQNDFLKVIEEEYLKSKFAVLGPQIFTLDGDNKSNPVEIIVDNRKLIKNLIMRRLVKLLICYIHLDFLINKTGKNIKTNGAYNSEERYENVKLHGSCWVFSPCYFEHFSGLNESTFLYFEEDILYVELMRKNLKTVYNPRLKIKHIEDSSTNFIVKNSRKKSIFVLKNEVKSLLVLKRIV